MKIIYKVAIIAAIAIGSSLSSCKKCTTCSYTVNNIEYKRSECGSSKEQKDFEDRWKATGDTLNVEVTCIKEPK